MRENIARFWIFLAFHHCISVYMYKCTSQVIGSDTWPGSHIGFCSMSLEEQVNCQMTNVPYQNFVCPFKSERNSDLESLLLYYFHVVSFEICVTITWLILLLDLQYMHINVFVNFFFERQKHSYFIAKDFQNRIKTVAWGCIECYITWDVHLKSTRQW